MTQQFDEDHGGGAWADPLLREQRAMLYKCYESAGFWVYPEKPTLPFGANCLELVAVVSTGAVSALVRFWAVSRKEADRLGLHRPNVK